MTDLFCKSYAKQGILRNPSRYYTSGLTTLSVILTTALTSIPHDSSAQGFPNVARTPGELLAGPIAPEQGRTAIVAWHGERIVSVPEPPGSQPGADVDMRIVDISDIDLMTDWTDDSHIQVTHIPAGTGGFNSHGYFKSGPYLYVGGHCLSGDLSECDGSDNQYRDSFVINGTGPTFANSNLSRASMQDDNGLAIGTYSRSGAQSPWGVRMWWSYGDVEGDAWLGVRRDPNDYLHDWTNGGAPTGPALQSTWDHLSDTGVIGFPFIMGNILIYASDQTGTGVATYDISDPTNPVLLDVLKEENPGGYWPEIYGSYIFFPRRNNEGGPGSQSGFMVVDYSDPTDLRVIADRNLEGSNQYVTFQDEYAFMNNYKIDMRTFEPVLELDMSIREPEGIDLDASQFALPVGNLVITGGYGTSGPGLAVWAHQAEPDTRSPYVLYHVPSTDQANYSTLCPITMSIPETLKTETIINGVSLIVQPIGGSPIPIYHAFGQNKLLTITPQEPFLENTTYEVILTSDIEDAAGNPLEPYTFRFSTGGSVSGGNQPPAITNLSITPSPAAPGTELLFSWSASDNDGDAMEYRVDFGDGSAPTDWITLTSLNHTYVSEGHFQATVQVRDALGSVSARSQKVTVITPLADHGATHSNILTQDASSGIIYTCNPDNDSVSAINPSNEDLIWEAQTGKDPRSIALVNSSTLWVANRDADTISIIDTANGNVTQTIELEYGSAPVALCPLPNGQQILVSCEGDGTVRRHNLSTTLEDDRVEVGPWPRAITVTGDSSRALVTRFISPKYHGEVYDIDLSGTMSLTRTIQLAKDRSEDGSASGRGIPNYLADIRISPDGGYAWVVGKKDNTTRGTFFSPNLPLGQDNTVRAILALIDLNTNQEDEDYRLDIDNSDSPTGIEFSPLGDYAFISLQGNNRVAVIDLLDFVDPNEAGTVETRWNTQFAPQGILIDDSNQTLYVTNLMSRSVSSIDISTFLDTGSANISSIHIESIEQDQMHPTVKLGKEIFYNASDIRMSAEGYISCATCHVDGMHDGRTYDFTNRGEGFRNTTDLRGRSGTWHGNVHWTANFDEIHDFENDIRESFGGEGFLTDEQYVSVFDTLGSPKAGLNHDLDALAAYVTSLGTSTLPRSPHRNSDGTLTEAALRGQNIFMTNNCMSCHDPENDYTDRLQHDVGTLKASSGSRLGQALTSIDTPTLLGLHASAPYLHDGSAETLEEVFQFAGGELVQAELASIDSNANAADVNWNPMKEWHNSEFIQFDGNGSITFNNITSSISGSGYIKLRYNAGYGGIDITVTANGNTINDVLPQTPNDPGWNPNEWRYHTVEVDYQAGSNSISIERDASGGNFKLDEVLFTTPEHLALANAHARNFSEQDLADLVAYLNSLDNQDAALPAIQLERNGETIDLTSGDEVQITPSRATSSLVYTLVNSGSGPLNFGQFYLFPEIESGFWIEEQPSPTLLPGQSTQLIINYNESSIEQSTTISVWTDAEESYLLQWILTLLEGETSSVPEALLIY